MMVKAIRVHTVGGPEVMQYEDIDLAPPGPGQIRVRHHACGINYIDVYFRSGLYPQPSYPFTPGSEGAGDVVAVGEGVTLFKTGDRVAYAAGPGSYAQERNVEASAVVSLPASIDYETGAAMMLKGLTAQYLLRQTFVVKKGETILVHAAAGGVGQILCQWGKHLGATVIATVSTDEKARIATEAGADHVILYSREDFAARVKELTQGKLCDVVYDGVGKATFPASLDCLRPRGLFVSFGNASGPIDAFPLGILTQKGSLYVTRPTMFSYVAARKDLETMASDLMEVVASGAVKIPMGKRYKLSDAAQAHRELESRATTGSGILIP